MLVSSLKVPDLELQLMYTPARTTTAIAKPAKVAGVESSAKISENNCGGCLEGRSGGSLCVLCFASRAKSRPSTRATMARTKMMAVSIVSVFITRCFKGRFFGGCPEIHFATGARCQGPTGGCGGGAVPWAKRRLTDLMVRTLA